MARHWLYSATKQAWNTPDVKMRVDDWAWGDELEPHENKLICTELKATPDEPRIEWVPAAFDTSGIEWTEITKQGPTDNYNIDMLEDVTFTTGGDELAQGSWAPRTKAPTWKWLHLANADADAQGLPRGMLMVPAAYDTSGYTEDSETTSVWVVNDISGGQYRNRGKKGPLFPPGVDVTVANWAGVRGDPASVSFQGSADAPDETDTSITWSHNVSAGSDLGFVVSSMSAASGSDKYLMSVTYNGDNLTQENGDSWIEVGNVGMENWYLENPDTGNNSVVMTRVGSGFVWTAVSFAFEGVDQDAMYDGGDSANGDSGTSSITINVGANDAAIVDFSMYYDTANQTAADSQTIVRQFPDSGPGIHVVWGYKVSISSGNNTHRYTHGSEDWIMSGFAVKASGAPAGRTTYNTDARPLGMRHGMGFRLPKVS